MERGLRPAAMFINSSALEYLDLSLLSAVAATRRVALLKGKRFPVTLRAEIFCKG